MVLNTAFRVLGDAQSAQDVHQEVFLAIGNAGPTSTERSVGPAIFIAPRCVRPST